MSLRIGIDFDNLVYNEKLLNKISPQAISAIAELSRKNTIVLYTWRPVDQMVTLMNQELRRSSIFIPVRQLNETEIEVNWRGSIAMTLRFIPVDFLITSDVYVHKGNWDLTLKDVKELMEV